MNRTCSKSCRHVWMLAMSCLVLAGQAAGVVLHDDSQQVPEAQRPPDAFVGRWVDDGSCVPISPTHVVTTRHQGYGVGRPVEIDGQVYTVAQSYHHSGADLRVVRLEQDGQAPNLTYAELYRDTDERFKTVVLGGYGLGRGDALVADDVTYGYEWASGTNDTLRWGQNFIDGLGTAGGIYTTRIIKADFDEFGLTYEGAIATYDSGGGWFINDGGTWKLAGLSRGAEHAALQQTWFRSSAEPHGPDADVIDAVRISSYVNWIDVMVRGPFGGDANGDDKVDYHDLGVLATNYGMSKANWADGDFTGDTVVGYMDLGILATNYGYDGTAGGSAGAGDTAVPEPAACALLLLGAAALLPRARRRR